MAKNNLLLVDLNDDKTKKLAETITSDTSRKILNHLADKEDTEANIADSTGIPISTVHYHLLKLQEASLVVAEEYHYSKKGREINHYKLANKYIIIAPRKVHGLKEKLRNILPMALFSVAAAGLIKLYTTYNPFYFARSASKVLAESAPDLMATKEAAAPASGQMLMAASPEIADTSANVAAQTAQPDIALWFLIGAASAIIIYLAYSLIREWIKSKRNN